MSKLLDRFRYFKQKGETFADGHGQVMHSNRDWEDSYRQRWQFDKIVRSTHGVNCTGSCSWKIYVKNGLVTWEIQQTDYPRTRPDLPNHEPRGCPRGASYSWYLYSANRLKYPLIRKRLIELWREALKQHSDPVLAWASIMNDPQKSLSYKQVRGRGGFIRSNWQELNQLIAAANVWTIKTYGPDRVAGFSPIPAMSMVSYAAGTRYLSLLGGTCLSFYDWYCDLPPASPMTWVLMEYPDELLWECKDDALALIRRDAPMLTDFALDLLNAPLLDKQAEWCEVFDRGRTTSLLLFEHVHAESRDRGQAMVDLLAEYEKVGLQLNCRELPDYLPLYLEYLSVLPDDQAKEGLLNVAPILALLGGRLKQREAPWYALFDALLQLAGSPLSSDSVIKQIRSEERDDTHQALDAVWEEEQVKFIEDNATACDSSPLNQYQRRFSQDVAPQYVDISAGGGK
ncbi:nitrate reductase 1 alpha subunit [Escherichia coli]|nr:nitrate reductase 1 alpha subunit [Escherichia coli]